jgi:hypothetical protein
MNERKIAVVSPAACSIETSARRRPIALNHCASALVTRRS